MRLLEETVPNNELERDAPKPEPSANEEEECEDVTEDTMSRRWSLEATAGVSQEDEEEEELMPSVDGESVDSETFITETESELGILRIIELAFTWQFILRWKRSQIWV